MLSALIAAGIQILINTALLFVSSGRWGVPDLTIGTSIKLALMMVIAGLLVTAVVGLVAMFMGKGKAIEAPPAAAPGGAAPAPA